ncbi:type II toxin-antitoxin system PemK/MazF family toxin [Actimicrobium antarcticum]|uniref:type II toxin-antitoxin system PemK/MazF family toxin n=1 Tax=Actimicrobium antarcticum TaxID=1051899 RepID=UPI0031CF40E3
MALPKVSRGQIWMVDLTPQTFPAEPGKRERPCLILQTDILNDAGHATTIVLPGTTQVYRDKQGDGYPLRVPIGTIQKPGQQPEETDILIDQIRAIANTRFIGTAPIGNLTRQHIKRVEDALKIVLTL